MTGHSEPERALAPVPTRALLSPELQHRDRGYVFTHLCARACMKRPGYYYVNAGIAYLHPGELIATIGAVAKWSGLTKDQARRCLEAFERCGLIDIEPLPSDRLENSGAPIPAGRRIRIRDIAHELSDLE